MYVLLMYYLVLHRFVSYHLTIDRRYSRYLNAIPTSPKSLSNVQPQFEFLTACFIPVSLSGPEKLARLQPIPGPEDAFSDRSRTVHLPDGYV